MRARAGDPPRTMPQKVLASRAADPALGGDLVEVKVDQVVLARSPNRALGEAVAAGLRRTPVELAIAYDGTCVTDAASNAEAASGAPGAVAAQMSAHDILVARPGIGFPGPVHLERFAAPARLCVTDEPRLASVGGAGMLVLVVPPGQLAQALCLGTVQVRPPRSIQVLLSGRMRPFVCARDVALELVRRGLGDVVRKVEAAERGPVVVEFAGPSARLLSVGERAVLCSIAPQLGAAAALFVGDEKTEVFLRDQRRSKAHRSLVPDPGAPCDEVVSVDLGAVDPLLCDELGQVRPVRDLAGRPVQQVVLGGDGGVTLKDMLAAASLLKSKRVPARLDLVVAPPSRQMLEVLAQSGALVDLIATGARAVEPDRRLVTGLLYPPAPGQTSLRSFDAEPRAPGAPSFLVASAESLAYAVATGAIGDPRSFKRPVRVTVPRELPTDDVLVVRGASPSRPAAAGSQPSRRASPATPPGAPRPPPAPQPAGPLPFGAPCTLELVEGVPADRPDRRAPTALLLGSLDEVRLAVARLGDLPDVRAIVAPFVPSALVALLADAGVAALGADAATLRALRGLRALGLPAIDPPPPSGAVAVTAGKSRATLTWLAVGAERAWTLRGTSRPAAARSQGGPHG